MLYLRSIVLGGTLLVQFACGTPLQHTFATSEKGRGVDIPWEEVVSIPQPDTWALNPAGDAAVIRVSTIDPSTSLTSYDLHLLAINAQFTVPGVVHGPTDPEALYTFLTNDTFATLTPAGPGRWDLTTQFLNYTSLPPAFPPSASKPSRVAELSLGRKPTHLVYSSQAGVLNVVAPGDASVEQGQIISLKLDIQAGSWRHVDAAADLLIRTGLSVEEVTTNGTHLAFTAHSPAIRSWNGTRSVLYLLDLERPHRLCQISTGKGGAVSSPAFGVFGQLAWLEQQEDGNARGQRRLWLFDEAGAWEAPLDFDLSPLNVLFSKNGEALNLLTLHNQEQSLFHLWVPKHDSAPIKPVRIPSNGTIHEATHIGITPLEHSHLVGVMSSLTSARELWVISHSPYDDPTDKYENIRLTYLSEPALRQRRLSGGQRVEFENDQGTTIHGRVFVPEGEGPFPMVFYLHGDEEGGGWHDWWMPYWNPNAFLAEGYAVVTINPTGAEGYSDTFTQARRSQWGGQTMMDLRLGLQHALAKFPISPDKMFAMGYGAFGGWAVHWLQGENDRWGFKGFVSHNGIVSPRWWAHETSAPSKPFWEFGPVSYDANSSYTLWDTEKSSDLWNTPELIIADGANDADVGPPSQSYAAFSILQSRGVKSRVLLSSSLVEWQRAIFEFLAEL